MTTPTLDNQAVRKAYRRWAPVYDNTFGRVSAVGRRRAVEYINSRHGRVLEAGVGTGLSLAAYAPHLEVVGIDLSPEMLDKARLRADPARTEQVLGLAQMDASALGFADGVFDIVAAMYVMTVVPEPEAVMRELSRVCAPGGEVILVNHFSRESGLRGWIEHRMAPLAETLGWHPVFETERVMVCPELELQAHTPMWPMGLFSMMRFVKRTDDAGGTGGAN